MLQICQENHGVGGDRQKIPRPPALSLACPFGDADRGVCWHKVASIQGDGVEEVYDLTVPVFHNFVADDFVVHNSIEQDADVVIFVYREDYYNEDTDRQNNRRPDDRQTSPWNDRNGQSLFRKELTQFRDLELRREDLDY